MADLPDERCGVDILGPYCIKERRSELKRYGALFTCFTCLVIHIKVTNALDTNSFILALRRFMARRGAVRSIRSDNGKNFVGTRNELQQGFKELIHDKTSWKKREQIGLTGTIIHQQYHACVAFGSVKSEQLETTWRIQSTRSVFQKMTATCSTHC